MLPASAGLAGEVASHSPQSHEDVLGWHRSERLRLGVNHSPVRRWFAAEACAGNTSGATNKCDRNRSVNRVRI